MLVASMIWWAISSMGVSNPTDYYIDVENLYTFKGHCHRKSYEAFKAAIEQQQYPSRFSLIFFCLFDTVTSPLYLAKKICEVALYIWNLSNLKDSEGNSLYLEKAPTIIGLMLFQLANVMVCTAIRVFSSVLGLAHPKYALEGWKLAEAGEELAYTLWAQQQSAPSCQESSILVCEDIHPASALFYLGIEQTRQILVRESEAFQQTEEEILMLFTSMLKHMLSANPRCFDKLLHYDKAIKLPKLTMKEQKEYILSHDTKQILLLLKERMKREDVPEDKEDSGLENEPDQLLIDCIAALTIYQLHRLFNHIYLNLRETLLCNELALDQQLMEQHYTQLSDMFSTHLKFGRAHFRQSACHLKG